MRLYLTPYAILVVCVVGSDYPRDPYATLGLSKTANIKEIKRAYKQLAKEWHPDKNTAPDAQERFVAISRAYELLSDPLKKERFDKFGTIDDTPQSSSYHHQHGFSGFEHFVRGRNASLFFRSYYQPFLLYAYSNYCQLCFRLQAQWKAISEDLGPLGYGIGTVNALTDGNLLEKLRVSRLPAIVAIVEGRVTHFRSDMFLFNEKDVRVFARDVIPRSFMGFINSRDALSRFVSQWEPSNKISVVVLGTATEPRMRYLLAAMKYSHFARFAYIHLSSPSKEVSKIELYCSTKFHNVNNLGTVSNLGCFASGRFVYQMYTISSSEYLDELCPVSSRNLRRICVVLPVMDSREDMVFLNSFRVFARQYNKKYAQQKVGYLLDFANSFILVVLTYIYVNKQSEWVKPFLENRNGESAKARDVLVLWRLEHVMARFTWLEAAWGGDVERFKNLLDGVISQAIKLEQTAPVGNLVNEYAPSWWTRVCRALVRMVQSAWFHLTKQEAYPVLSAVATFFVILIVGYGLNYMNQEAKPKKVRSHSHFSSIILGMLKAYTFVFKENPKKNTSEEWHPEDPQSKNEAHAKSNSQVRLQRYASFFQLLVFHLFYGDSFIKFSSTYKGYFFIESAPFSALSIMSPHIHELRAESYFGMIRLLKPGCRSLILLVDEQSKNNLLMQFAVYILPLKNNKTFSFGYLMVEKNLPWFRKLLEHTLPLGDSCSITEGDSLYVKLKSINPRQTIGTVLSLCGWKLYFSIYHPMHRTEKKKHQSQQHFLGFDSEDDTSSGSDMVRRGGGTVSEENVLNGFPNWLDRLLEGSVRRYYIPEWPDNLR
uniref:J domain-containing protein n=1 Tax=Angiostrongylus cantonensis TaxID=6313 RepID=A0A158PCI0_ANGCA